MGRLKEYLKTTPAYDFIDRWRQVRALREWEARGENPPPPQAYKYDLIRKYGQRFGIDVLVETGTCFGDAIQANLPFFREIYSIELGRDLFERAQNRFRRRPSVKLFQGDSGVVLREVLDRVKEPALFWLDGHYSEGVTAKGELNTPIRQELALILARRLPDVILIDDARCFTGRDDYPSIDEIRNEVSRAAADRTFEAECDILRILPPERQ